MKDQVDIKWKQRKNILDKKIGECELGCLKEKRSWTAYSHKKNKKNIDLESVRNKCQRKEIFWEKNCEEGFLNQNELENGVESQFPYPTPNKIV